MGYVFLGLLALLISIAGYQFFRRFSASRQALILRWGLGGAAAILTAFLALWRRIDLAVFTGAAAISILRFGRLGPFTIGGVGKSQPGNVSEVRSRFLHMALDHDSGAVAGRVVAGRFAGADLGDLGEDDARALLTEVGADPDSLRLLESWLDANRAGWRDLFGQQDPPVAAAPDMSSEEEAWAVLGLTPGASAEDIRRAHRDLMKGIHPDRGGSGYLAAKLNQARDLLLKKQRL